MNDATKTRAFSFSFNSAIPVPEKARAMGIGRYADVAWRNMEIAVRVTVPEKAVEFSLVEMPAQRKHNIRSIEIVMDASLSDSDIQVCLPREDLAKVQDRILEVDYDREEMEGKVVVTIALPPPVAVVLKRINLPRTTMGEPCSNAVVFVEVDNVAGTYEPQAKSRGRGRGRFSGKDRVVNHRLQTMHNYWFNYWVNREVDPDDPEAQVEEYSETYFWPATRNFCVIANDFMLQDPRDLVREEGDALVSSHPATEGAHANLLASIVEERFRVYQVPEFASTAGGRGQRHMCMQDMQMLVNAMDSGKISKMLTTSDIFLPRADSPNDFFCCLGVNDPKSNNTVVTYVAFGYTVSLYRMRRSQGRREFVVDTNGNKVVNEDQGALALVTAKTARQAVGALYAEFVNGGMDKFYKDNLLLIPDEAFAGDDEQARLQYHERKRAIKANGAPAEDGSAVDDDAPNSEPKDDTEGEDGGVEFGEFSDKLPPAASVDDESEDDSDDSTDDESEEEKSEDSTQTPTE